VPQLTSKPGSLTSLAPTKAKVLAEYEKRKEGKLNDEALDKLLNRSAGQRFHNHSPLTFDKLKGDPDRINQRLTSYIKGFSMNVRRIFEYFEFDNEIGELRKSRVSTNLIEGVSIGVEKNRAALFSDDSCQFLLLPHVLFQLNSSSNALASCKSLVSNPSVNQP
jgi:hypothetical protein